jgi:hypothetical protein
MDPTSESLRAAKLYQAQTKAKYRIARRWWVIGIWVGMGFETWWTSASWPLWQAALILIFITFVGTLILQKDAR